MLSRMNSCDIYLLKGLLSYRKMGDFRVKEGFNSCDVGKG